VDVAASLSLRKTTEYEEIEYSTLVCRVEKVGIASLHNFLRFDFRFLLRLHLLCVLMTDLERTLVENLRDPRDDASLGAHFRGTLPARYLRQ
jgi:hypothetical protein